MRLLIIITLLVVFTFFLFPVTDFDIWWHLATGKLIIENRELPQKEVFSYTAYGNPWRLTSWAFAASSYLSFQFLGVNGMNILKAIISFSVFSLIIFYLHRKKLLNLASLLFVVLALFSIRERFSLRPHTISYLFFVSFLILLLKYKENKSYKYIFSLSLLQFVWVNFHASFIYGIAFSSFLLFSDWFSNEKIDKKNVVLLSSILGASLLHLFYWHQYVFRTISRFFLASQYQISVREFLPPTLGTFFSLLGLVLLSVFLVIYFSFKEKQADILLIALFVTIISLRSSRFLPDLVLFLSVVAPSYFQKIQLPKFNFNISKRVLNALYVFLLFLLFLGVKNQSFGWGLGLQKFTYPVKAVEWIKAEKLLEKSGGQIYNTYNFGGYLMWTIYPHKIFIDGRAFPYYGEIFENYWKNFEDEDVWKNTIEKYNITLALMTLPHGSGETTYNDSSKMFPKEDWALVYYDDVGIVYLKRMEELSDIINKHEYKVINPQAVDFAYFAEIIKNQEDFEDAIEEVKRALQISPDSYRLHFTMSYLYNFNGQTDEMLKEIKKTLEINPSFGAAQRVLDEYY